MNRLLLLIILAALVTLAAAAQDRAVPAASAQGSYPVPTNPVPPVVVPPPLLSPFPIVRIVGRVTRRGVRLRILSVRAPSGAVITVRCRGRRCPVRQVVSTGLGINRAVRIGRLQRRLRAGIRFSVSVTRGNTIGKYTRFRVRRGRAPARVDRCLLPGETHPVECPEG